MKQFFSAAFLWLTAPICVLLAVASGSGVFINGLYRDVPTLVSQAKGQDLVSLVVVLPVLAIAALFAWRGSLTASLIWLGGLVYMVYTYVGFAFAIQYNPLFLVYIALLGCSLYGLIGGLATLDVDRVRTACTAKTPGRAAGAFLMILTILFYFVWLSELVPALLASEIPPSILEDGTPTNAIHVLDLAWILPAFGIAALSLWRKQSLGYALAGVLLTFAVLMILAILAMGITLMLEGDYSALPMTVLFGVLMVTASGMAFWFLSSLRRPAEIAVKNTRFETAS